MTSKASALLSFLRDFLLGAAALAVMAGVALLAGKIYVLFQPEAPSHFFIQAEEIKPGTWIYLLVAAFQALMFVGSCLLLLCALAFGVLALKGAGEIVRNLMWRARHKALRNVADAPESEDQALTASGAYPVRDERIDGPRTEA
ncbi:hypothetical protein [Ancylobacter oerskovii]|uniref:Uncharacterized protein n=1 Tax=Ancylobacter oerskovii TaxID=459519 RepID=A0ABW4Z5G1_9HYPH|nr:hypothetical protein [Ancylobacter oerskovii]MBS7545559.1 hypothetical protein [Ancylobacter oerskovii]